jgi:hypothetical protein
VHHKGSHYVASQSEAADMRRAAALGDDICKRLDEKYGYNKPVGNAKFVTNSRRDSIGDDMRASIIREVSEQMAPIASAVRDAVSNALKTTKHIDTRPSSPVPASNSFKAMTERVVSSTASDKVKTVANAMSDFNRRQQEARARSDRYWAREGAAQRARANNLATNANDPAFRAMNEYQGNDAVLAAIKARRG